jgi:hypothetical protein
MTALVSFRYAFEGAAREQTLLDALICIALAIGFGAGSIGAWYTHALSVSAGCTLCFALLAGSATGSAVPVLFGLKSPFPPR